MIRSQEQQHITRKSTRSLTGGLTLYYYINRTISHRLERLQVCAHKAVYGAVKGLSPSRFISRLYVRDIFSERLPNFCIMKGRLEVTFFLGMYLLIRLMVPITFTPLLPDAVWDG